MPSLHRCFMHFFWWEVGGMGGIYSASRAAFLRAVPTILLRSPSWDGPWPRQHVHKTTLCLPITLPWQLTRQTRGGYPAFKSDHTHSIPSNKETETMIGTGSARREGRHEFKGCGWPPFVTGRAAERQASGKHEGPHCLLPAPVPATLQAP